MQYLEKVQRSWNRLKARRKHVSVAQMLKMDKEKNSVSVRTLGTGATGKAKADAKRASRAKPDSSDAPVNNS